MRTASPRFIAAQDLIWLLSNGTETAFTIRVGEPCQVDGRTWACPLIMEGLDGQPRDIVGVSSLHALCMAIRHVEQFLGHLIAHGETFVYPVDRSPFDGQFLSAMFGRSTPKPG